MNKQALVDALIKFQNWCDEWPKIKDHIDALTSENAKLRGLIKDIMEFLDKPVPDVHSLNQTQREEYIEDKIELESKIQTVLEST